MMDVHAANASAFPGSPFDHDWNLTSGGQNGALGPIEEFNASYDPNNGGTIDPHLTLNNPATPRNDFSSSYNSHMSGLDQTLGQAPSPHDSFQPYFDGTTPYYQSVEANPNPIYQNSSLRFQHRRSVSEPPGGPAMPPPPPPMTLHRDNHYLGHPIPNKAVPLKSMPKVNKQQRPHPYSRKQRDLRRPDMRRAQTQPTRAEPTSTPYMMPPCMPQNMMPEPHNITSRVCTPTPEGGAMSPLNIDPALSAAPSPMQTATIRSDPRKTLLIPLTVDELRAMVFEAVQKAVGSMEATNEEVGGGASEDTIDGEESIEVKKIDGESGVAPGELDL